MQLALKLLGNATSYGVLVEVVVDEHAAEVPCMIYRGGEVTRRVARKASTAIEGEDKGEREQGFKCERPGKYFAPFGGLIPAAGRLLLAIAETLFRAKGIPFLLCDTDSMCPAKPANMSRTAFRKAVLEVAGPDGWFQPLSPYSDGGTLFAVEDINYKLRDDTSGKVTDQLEPLYCLAISAKRYALFNIVNNETIIRKISAHGLCDLRRVDDYDPNRHKLTKREHIAAPLDDDTGNRKYCDLAHGSTPRLLGDIWRIAIDCFRIGTQDKIDDILSKLPQLQVPQYTQIALSSSHLLKLCPICQISAASSFLRRSILGVRFDQKTCRPRLWMNIGRSATHRCMPVFRKRG